MKSLGTKPLKTREGLLSEETIRALARLDRNLFKVFEELVTVALMVSDDVCGNYVDASYDEALQRANVHPMHRLIWNMLSRMETDGTELQKYLDLEKNK